MNDATTNGESANSNGTQQQQPFNRLPYPTINRLFGEGADPKNVQAFTELVSNVLLTRSNVFNKFLDPRRDIDAECGFPTGWIPSQVYWNMFDRDALAARVVEVLPKETWQTTPLVFEKESGESATAFENAWDELPNQLRGEQSWYQDEAGNPVWEVLERADILSGIGQYGVILFGFDDGRPLNEPVKGVEEQGSIKAKAVVDKGDDGKPKGPAKFKVNKQVKRYSLTVNADQTAGRKLLYLRAFPEVSAQVTMFETNRASPRFGQPVMYQISMGEYSDSSSGIGQPTDSMAVHWTRVQHVADGIRSNESLGTQRCRQCLNILLGAQKVYGGAPEMYWRGAFPGISLETLPGIEAIDNEAVKTEMEQYMNGLQRYISLMGMSAKTLTPNIQDPRSWVDILIEVICIKLGMPKRVFMGSERGELASSQDDAAWNDRLRARQHNYVTPRLIIPFIDRLIQVGVLPEPEGYSIEWPDLTSLSDAEKATIAQGKVTAMAAFISGGCEAYMTKHKFLTYFFGMSDEEATSTLDDAEKDALEQEKNDMLAQVNAPLVQDPNAPPMDPNNPNAPPGQQPPGGSRFGQKAPPFGGKQVGGNPFAKKPAFPPQPSANEELADNWSPDQPRDSDGKFAGGSGGGSGASSGSAAKGTAAHVDSGSKQGNSHEVDPPTQANAQQAKGSAKAISAEQKTAPPPGAHYHPDVEADHNKDGVTDASRVGVPAMTVPPPPPIQRLPNLTPHERAVEDSFINALHDDPKGMTDKFLDVVKASTKPGDPPTFGTDDAKVLHEAWASPNMTPEQRAENRATLNLALHQTANAIAKNAFIAHLDTLEEGDNIMVTVGGCGAGKGYSLGKVPEVLAMKQASKAVWDSAGDQNATENPWIQQEAQRRGLTVTYAFVHADPETQWAHPERGVVKRAADPKDGRMVDAHVFADSYALGARNHQAFYERNKDNPSAKFVFLSNGQKIDSIPQEALNIDRNKLATFAREAVHNSGAPPRVIRGATMGARIWGGSNA